MFRLLLTTGLTIAELASLNVRHVLGQVVLQLPGSSRCVELPPRARQAVQAIHCW